MNDRTTYEVTVDPDACEGFGACQAAAPHLFHLDPETGLKVTGTVLIDASQADGAIRPAAACPECAISVRVTTRPLIGAAPTENPRGKA